MSEYSSIENIKPRLRSIISVGITAVVIVALVLVFLDYRELSVALRSIRPWYIPLILVIMPINYITRYFKFHYYLKVLGYKVALRDEIVALVSSFAMVITPAKLGEMLLKGYMLQQKYKLTMTATMAMTVAERITDGFAMVMLSAIGLAFMQTSYGATVIVAVCAAMLCIVFVVQNRSLCTKILGKLGRIRYFKKYADGFLTFYENAREIFRFRPLIVATLWGVAAWLCEAAVVCLSVRALGGSICFPQGIFAVSFSGIAGAVSLMPGGLLVADGTILGLLVWMGQSFSVSGAAMLISRFSTMWLGVVLGVIALGCANVSGLLKGKVNNEK